MGIFVIFFQNSWCRWFCFANLTMKTAPTKKLSTLQCSQWKVQENINSDFWFSKNFQKDFVNLIKRYSSQLKLVRWYPELGGESVDNHPRLGHDKYMHLSWTRLYYWLAGKGGKLVGGVDFKFKIFELTISLHFPLALNALPSRPTQNFFNFSECQTLKG